VFLTVRLYRHVDINRSKMNILRLPPGWNSIRFIENVFGITV